ncbi:MAG: hypothetical protein ACRDK7_08310 [Solirubrobacteraceae bacterium]
MSRRVPYTWRIGVDNAFGYLTGPGPTTRLAESRRFASSAGVMTGVAVSLDEGSALLTAADGTSSWQPVAAQRACELAGIPAPRIDGSAETARRLDPFHVERHTSAVFAALVALTVERRLPCAHALRAWRLDQWDGTFDGAYLEQPETFAASVLERIAARAQEPADAVLAALADDLGATVGAPGHATLARQTGWASALEELPARMRHLGSQFERARSSRREASKASAQQLALL